MSSMASGDGSAGVVERLPVVTIVTAADSLAAVSMLETTVSSVARQSSAAWELVVAVGPTVLPEVEALARRVGVNVGRGGYSTAVVVPFHGSVAEGWSAAISSASGHYVMVIDAGTSIAVDAVSVVCSEMERHGYRSEGQLASIDGLPGLIYGDEDTIDGDGRRGNGFYKPSFSPDRLRVQDYLGEAVMYRRDLVKQVGGLRTGHGMSARYDLSLRVAEQAECIVHIPAILVNVAKIEGRAETDGSLAAVVQEHLTRTRFPGQVVEERVVDDGLINRQSVVAALAPRLDRHPNVSIIIPTGGSSRVVRGRRQRLVDLALDSLTKTDYPNIEIVVVFDRNSDMELQHEVGQLLLGRPHRLVQDNRRFNYSQACNLGAAQASGEVLVFLNDDTEIVNRDWLDRLVMYATHPQIGAVGVKLLYEDGRLQHTGVWAREGHVSHRYSGFDASHNGVRGSLIVQLNCSAVTAACMAVERFKFEHVGGFCTDLPLAFNDVDLCFKLQMAGFRSMVDNDNVVTHLESSSRNPSTHQWELDHVHARWRPTMYFDPYENPNNTGRDCDEYPPTPPEMADDRWRTGRFQRNGRIWRRAPITVEDLCSDRLTSTWGDSTELVEVGRGAAIGQSS